MLAANTEMVVAYEELGMSPEEIASEYGYELSAIKAVLLAYSKKYKMGSMDRLKEGVKSLEDITDDEFDQINRAYINLALYGENETVREKALRTLRDEKRGRLPTQIPQQSAALKTIQVNILQLNESVKEAKRLKELLLNGEGDIKERAKRGVGGRVTEGIETETETEIDFQIA